MAFSLYEWRARPAAILPLAFLQSFGLGLLELPIVYIFRDIRCQAYQTQPFEAPGQGEDICRSPAVQRAYSMDVAWYLAILTIMSVVVSGPFGKLSDKRGRKIVLGIAAASAGAGDIWLWLSAIFSPLRTVPFIMVSALIKGFGGGFSVMIAAQSAFIAETSSTATRSFYLGLSLVMFWLAGGTAPLLSAVLLEGNRYGVNFLISAALWGVYAIYLVFVLRETRVPGAHSSTDGIEPVADPIGKRQSFVRNLHAFWHTLLSPLILLFSNAALRWLSVAYVLMLMAYGAFNVLIVYCDNMFGMGPSEAGVLVSVMSISRAIAVLCILPLFVALYRRVFVPHSLRNKAPNVSNETDSENTPLLSPDDHSTHHQEASAEETEGAKRITVLQELVICRISFIIDAIGMVLFALSENAPDILLSAGLGSLGASAGPSLKALVTLAASPDELGTVLAGFSILESTASAARGPVMFLLYSLTLETWTSAFWWVAAATFLFCMGIMWCLRPTMFSNHSKTQRE